MEGEYCNTVTMYTGYVTLYNLYVLIVYIYVHVRLGANYCDCNKENAIKPYATVASSSSISTTKESTQVQPKNMQQLIKASAIDNATAVKPVTITLSAAGTGLHCNTVEKSTPRPQTTVTVSPNV